MTDAARTPTADVSARATPRRALLSLLVFQLGIGALLVMSDLRAGPLPLPGIGPRAPGMDQPTRPGDQTRRFDPSRMPGLPADRSPLPDRLVLTGGTDGTWTLEGTIAPGDADRIAGQLSEATTPPTLIRLNSPGGSVSDALALGRTLRETGTATDIPETAYCFSACPYLFAAGTTRTATGPVGVHQHYFGESTILPASFAVEDIQRGQAGVMTYLDEMGIDPLLMQPAMSTPPDEIYILTPDELTRYRLTTPD